tara:strand:+ start:365 stop:1318 length:954 start_codon:yes stop_codon:yes gene_type:complete
MAEYKFPDELDETVDDDLATTEASDGGEIEIEIVDDTPERDRGRKPLDKEVADPTDEEIDSYSDGVKKRIKELTHARHDERRQKESILRERQELERLAQQLMTENNSLKRNVNSSNEIVADSFRNRAATEVDQAKRALKDAHESFDTDAIIAAQELLTEAKMRAEAARNFRPAPLQEQEIAVQTRETQTQQVTPDEKSLRWQARNQWFGATGFEEYTSYALGLHQKLVNGGTDPRADGYYEQINARMKSKFPELFGGTDDRKSGEAKRPSTIVASASRSTGVGKIRLTATQVALAKKFGLTPQQYAAQVAKLESQNG